MLAVVMQVGILLLSVAIFPLQLYWSYTWFCGHCSAQKVVNETLFLLLIVQSALWYTYAAVSNQYFITFTSMTNMLCHLSIWYCITHTTDRIEVTTGNIIVADAPPRAPAPAWPAQEHGAYAPLCTTGDWEPHCRPP